jgi:tetratricopeptide (TPR) repeat protein
VPLAVRRPGRRSRDAPVVSWCAIAQFSPTSRIRALFEREIGQLDRAIALLLESRKMDESNVWALFDLAQVYGEFGEFDAARGAMDELMARGADVPEFHVANARLHAEGGDFVAALNALDAVPLGKLTEEVEKLQRRLRLQLSVRKAVERAGLPDQLLPSRQRLTALERQVDGAPELMAIVALAWGQIGDYDQALTLMDSAVTQSMYDSIPLRLQRISLLLQAGRHEELEAELVLLRDEPGLSPREARDLDRLRVANYVRRADSATEAGDPELALIYLRPLLREDPDSPQVLNALGRQLFASGAFKEAESVFLPLLERDPDDMEARQGAILASLRLGRKRQAKELIEEGIATRPDDAAMHLIAGRAEAMVGNDGKAMKHLREAQAMEEGRYVTLGVDLSQPSGPAAEGDPDKQVVLAQLVRQVVEDGGEVRASGPGPRASLMQEIAAEMETVRARHAPRMNGGIEFRFRGGQDGLSRMTELGVPVGVQFPTGFRGELDIHVRPTFVSSGALDATSAEAAESFGSYGTVSLALPGEDEHQRFGVAVGASFGYRGYRVHVGSSPIGFRLPTIVGGFEVGDRFEAFGFRLRGFREMVNDSVLSYAGEEDPLTGKVWGGVTRNGGDADLSLTRNRFNVYIHGGFFALLGTNVPLNTQWKAGGGVQWTVLDLAWGKLITGVAATAFGYKENLRFFSYGHAGYFSPQVFINAHIPLMLAGTKGNFGYGIEAQIGLNWFREDAADWFPGRDDLMDARSLVLDADGAPVRLFYETRDALSFALNASGYVSYAVTPRLEAKLDLHIYTAAEYWEFVGGLGVTYRFGRPARK